MDYWIYSLNKTNIFKEINKKAYQNIPLKADENGLIRKGLFFIRLNNSLKNKDINSKKEKKII